MPKPYAVDAGCVELTAPRQPDHSRQPGRWIQDIDQRKEPAMYLLDYTTARVLMEARLLEAELARRAKGVGASGSETNSRRVPAVRSAPAFRPPIHTAGESR